MELKLDDTQTSLNISQEVILTIANEAVREIKGIYSLANLPMKSKLFATTKVTTRPVRISFVSDAAHVDIGIIVNMNYRLRDVAEQVQAAIKNSVQDMTGITVSKVNVFVSGVHLKSDSEIVEE